MNQASFTLKGGDWEEQESIFSVQAKATEWVFDRKQEAFEKVAKDNARKLSTVQKIMLGSTDYLRRTIAPARSKCHAVRFVPVSCSARLHGKDRTT